MRGGDRTVTIESLPDEPGASTLSPSQAERIDAICGDFEADWKAGLRPRIEPLLAEALAIDRDPLLRNILRVELTYRSRMGEVAAVEEYRARFPTAVALVDVAFGTVEATEMLPTEEGGSSPPVTHPNSRGERFRPIRSH